MHAPCAGASRQRLRVVPVGAVWGVASHARAGEEGRSGRHSRALWSRYRTVTGLRAQRVSAPSAAVAPHDTREREADEVLPALCMPSSSSDGAHDITQNCAGLQLTRVAVPTGIQPIFPGKGSAGMSLRRLLRPCLAQHGCTLGADGCFVQKPRPLAIGRCNATHGVEYEHRLPLDGEPAIVSFFNPSASNVREALAAVAKARPRLYIEFEPPVHARVPQAQVLLGVDGQMTYARRAMVHYPYFTPTQLWSAARQPAESRGFHERLPAIAVFVSLKG